MPKIDIQLIKALRESTGSGIMACKRALIETDSDLDAAGEFLRAQQLHSPKTRHRPTPEGVIACLVEGGRGVLIELLAETDFVSRSPLFHEAASSLARIALEAGAEIEPTLRAPSPDMDGDVSHYLTRLSAQVGENIVLRRVDGLSTKDGVLGAYVHDSRTPGVGRIAALVSVAGGSDKASADIARNLALHVVGASPLWTSIDEVPASVTTQKYRGGAEASDPSIHARLEKFYEQTVLLRQRHLLAPEFTVAEVLATEAGANSRVEGFLCFRVGEDASHDARVAQAVELEWTFGNDWSSETPLRLVEAGEIKVFEVRPSGPKLRDDRDAVDLINAAWSVGTTFIALPIERLGEDFFPLNTRRAGTILQKFSSLGTRLAIVGDLSAQIAESAALRDFIYEANRGEHIWFVADMESLLRRLRRLT